MVSLEKKEFAGETAISNPVVSKPILPILFRKGYNNATAIMPNSIGISRNEKSEMPRM
jgi:hypothetical protein